MKSLDFSYANKLNELQCSVFTLSTFSLIVQLALSLKAGDVTSAAKRGKCGKRAAESGKRDRHDQKAGNVGPGVYNEFIKMAGAPERGILGPTQYLFTDFFRPKVNQEYRSRKEKQKT